jgi:acetyl esterase/lipase
MPPSLESQVARQNLEKDKDFSEGFSLAVQRQEWNDYAAGWPLLPALNIEPLTIAGVPCEKASFADSDSTRLLLYLHGGGFYSGSAMTHRAIASDLAQATRQPVLVVDYRLAPEHPYPAALEDACLVYRWLLANGYPSRQLVIAGDSAGGGLAMSALLHLRDEGDSLPAGVVLFSPWADLTLSGESMTTRADVDPTTSRRVLDIAAGYYARDHDLSMPMLSPVFADLHGLPPMMIHVGDDEILLSDAIRLAERAEQATLLVELHIWEGLWHCFFAWSGLPESQQTLAMVADFCTKVSCIEL